MRTRLLGGSAASVIMHGSRGPITDRRWLAGANPPRCRSAPKKGLDRDVWRMPIDRRFVRNAGMANCSPVGCYIWYIPCRTYGPVLHILPIGTPSRCLMSRQQTRPHPRRWSPRHRATVGKEHGFPASHSACTVHIRPLWQLQQSASQKYMGLAGQPETRSPPNSASGSAEYTSVFMYICTYIGMYVQYLPFFLSVQPFIPCSGGCRFAGFAEHMEQYGAMMVLVERRAPAILIMLQAPLQLLHVIVHPVGMRDNWKPSSTKREDEKKKE